MAHQSRPHHNRRFLYVFSCRTPYGFPYNAYGHRLADMPATATSFSVHLWKR